MYYKKYYLWKLLSQLKKFLELHDSKNPQISHPFFPKNVTRNWGCGLSAGIFKKGVVNYRKQNSEDPVTLHNIALCKLLKHPTSSGVHFSIFVSDLMPGY